MCVVLQKLYPNGKALFEAKKYAEALKVFTEAIDLAKTTNIVLEPFFERLIDFRLACRRELRKK